jgi:hypothetical protein
MKWLFLIHSEEDPGNHLQFTSLKKVVSIRDGVADCFSLFQYAHVSESLWYLFSSKSEVCCGPRSR